MSRADVIDNARALELYMRVSPEAASFLDCFRANTKLISSQVRFDYEKPLPQNEDKHLATECKNHLTLLFLSAKTALEKSIDVEGMDPEAKDFPILSVPENKMVKRRITEGESLGMHVAIHLDDPRLKGIILDLVARLINERRKNDPHYSLSYFEEDEPALKEKLDKGFVQEVKPKDLDTLLHDMLKPKEWFPLSPYVKRLQPHR